MTPFYSEPNIDIYVGKFQDVLPQLDFGGKADLCLVDPPYGIGLKYDKYEDSAESWRALMKDLIGFVKDKFHMGIMPCCRIVELPWIYTNIPPDWLIAWYKGSPGHRSYIGFNDWEPLLVYGKTHNLQMHDYFQCKPEANKNGHPCPKPVAWASWLISRATKEGDLVVDPCMGSGTCALACRNMGRRFTGVELSEEYASIAVARLKQKPLFDFQIDWTAKTKPTKPVEEQLVLIDK